MKIETNRLTIIPLSYNQMEKYILPNQLETELSLNQNNKKVSERIATKIKNKILPKIKSEMREFYFETFWTIILKPENFIAAEICFKGKPNEHGEVEIGYETFIDYRNKGIITEAIGEIAKWTFENTSVKTIIAETDSENLSSQRTLEKNKFKKSKIEIDNIIWRLYK